MIIKGKSRSDPSALAAHLGNSEKNEHVNVVEIRGTVAADLRGALVEMDALAAGTRCEKPLYHAAISPEPPHRLSERQREIAVNTLELNLGFQGHPRVVVVHEKEGREHIHVVWSRIDLEQNRAVSDSHNYRKHEEVARDLERQFDHERVQGALFEREGVERPDRTPSRAELRQEERTGITGKMVKADITTAFRASDTASSFQAAIEERGYVLAQGDRRDFVIVDRAGGIHSLARRIDGVRAAELRDFMSSIDRASLPTAEQARQLAQERKVRQEELAFKDLMREGYEADKTYWRKQAEIEKGYSRGDDYVSQSQAALKDHRARQDAAEQKFETQSDRKAQEEELLRRQAEESTRRQEGERVSSEGPKASIPGQGEQSDAKQERLSRLMNAISEEDNEREHPDPDRQHEAPSGGRTRSR